MQRTLRRVIVVKLSGSLFFSSQFKKVVDVLSSFVSTNESNSLVLVAGGGAVAREYIRAANKFGADQSSLDEVGIALSRLNAAVLRGALGKYASSSVPRTLSEIEDEVKIPAKSSQRIVVCGGLHPGQSTNAVSALVAEKTGAERLINATDVNGVYDRDPKKFRNAKKLDRVSAHELGKILDRGSVAAGKYDLMDPVALKIIARSRIPTWIVKCDPKTLERSLFGRSAGTIITF